ncbi:hypothetical protein HanRHA438_Chr15g0715491 [Helianthus annuus]|nr:hypothetical protein HanRHA438_Chr15g0715491 [Helianthus annuus]
MTNHFLHFYNLQTLQKHSSIQPFSAESGQQHSAFLSDFQLTSHPISSLFIFLKHLDNL